jgi:hypothetical protein
MAAAGRNGPAVCEYFRTSTGLSSARRGGVRLARAHDGPPIVRRGSARRHAVSSAATCWSRNSAIAISRMRNFCTFPVTVVGNSSTNFQ